MAVVTVIEAGIGIMVSIYNSMSDRRHEIAVMRALGASRVTVMVIILMESILLSLMGGAIGLLLGHGITWLCSPMIVEWTGVVVGLLQFQPARIDPGAGPDRAGLGRGLSARLGGLSHRRGQVVDYHAVAGWIGVAESAMMEEEIKACLIGGLGEDCPNFRGHRRAAMVGETSDCPLNAGKGPLTQKSYTGPLEESNVMSMPLDVPSVAPLSCQAVRPLSCHLRSGRERRCAGGDCRF